jgi:hypothetical protein
MSRFLWLSGIGTAMKRGITQELYYSSFVILSTTKCDHSRYTGTGSRAESRFRKRALRLRSITKYDYYSGYTGAGSERRGRFRKRALRLRSLNLG